MRKEAILTKDIRVGVSSRTTVKAGTRVVIEERGDGRFIIHKGEYSAFIEADKFRFDQHQQQSLFGEAPNDRRATGSKPQGYRR